MPGARPGGWLGGLGRAARSMASPTQRAQTAKGLGTPELPLSLLPLTENHVPSACFVGPVGLAINRGIAAL